MCEITRYYALTDLVPAHFAAIALNPEIQCRYFESEWESRPDWILSGKTEVRKLWESQYKQPPATSEEQRLRVVH